MYISDTVAGRLSDILAAVLQSVIAYFLSADSHVLWSCHLLLCCCHGDDGNYRDAVGGTVCQFRFIIIIIIIIITIMSE